MARKKHELYVGKRELMAELQLYNDTVDPEHPELLGEASEELGIMLIKIASRYASKPNFYGYTFKDDMVGDAILRMLKNLGKIDLEHPRCNPFSYLTMICHNVFLAWISKSKRRETTKREVARSRLLDLENGEGLERSKQFGVLQEMEDALG